MILLVDVIKLWIKYHDVKCNYVMLHHVVTNVTITVTDSFHRQLARITTACVTCNGVFSGHLDAVSKYVKYMQAPSVEGVRNF